jgi:hypothetical protein
MLTRKPPPRPFPKGQSSNPRGRLPGAKNLKTLLGDALNEFVIVTENGGRRKITQARGDHHPPRQSLGLPIFRASTGCTLSPVFRSIVRNYESTLTKLKDNLL